MTLKHFTGQNPSEDYNKYYNAMDSDDMTQNWNYSEATITGVVQYQRLPKREERATIATAGVLVNRTAWLYLDHNVTIEQGDQVTDGTEEFMVEMVFPHILSTGDYSRNVVYYEAKLQRTMDMR
jgi:hypothetical protein